MSKSVVFSASFPAIQSAIKITGDGTGMRIQLDIPETDMPEAIKLMLYRQCALKVTVEPQPNPLQPVKQKPKSEEDLLDEILDDNPNL